MKSIVRLKNISYPFENKFVNTKLSHIAAKLKQKV